MEIQQAKQQSLINQLNNMPFVMTPKQARKEIGIGHNKIYELLNTNKLKAKKLKGKWLINKFDLIDFILEGEETEEDIKSVSDSFKRNLTS